MKLSAGTLEAIHQLIVDGRGAQARPLLLKVKSAGLEREMRAKFAWLCWRAGVPELGLEALAPCVRTQGHVLVVATPAELSERAQCLTRSGAPSEALHLLKDIPTSEYPRANLYLAAARIARWDYKAALPELQNYLTSTPEDSYERMVAQLNLAAALVYEGQGDLASLALQKLAQQAASRKAPVLHANALEIEAQILLSQRRFEESLTCIRRASEILSRSGMNDFWYTKKWEAIAIIRGESSERIARETYLAAKHEAKARKNWESLRQLDREMALKTKDEALFSRVYFGSPYPAYRETLHSAWGGKAQPEFWEGQLGMGMPKKDVLDLLTGAYGDRQLASAKLLHRVLYTLAADFYRPQTPASLFSVIFPGEIYHPEYGKRRVHQALFLLRRWAEKMKVPVAVVEENGFYRLEGTPGCLIRVPAWSPWEAKPWRGEISRRNLIQLGKEKEFTSTEAAGVMGTSPRTTLRILTEGLKEGWLSRKGNRKGARYQIL